MRLCRGNGAQVHNSERDPETGTATGEMLLCFADGCLETVIYMMLMSSGMSLFQATKVVQYNINTEELYVILKEFIHILYFRWDSAALIIYRKKEFSIFSQNTKMVVVQHRLIRACLICHNQASAGEPSRQKSGHHRVHPLPVSLQGDAHQGFLQTVWGKEKKENKQADRVLLTLQNTVGKRVNIDHMHVFENSLRSLSLCS